MSLAASFIHARGPGASHSIFSICDSEQSRCAYLRILASISKWCDTAVARKQLARWVTARGRATDDHSALSWGVHRGISDLRGRVLLHVCIELSTAQLHSG